MISVIGKDMSRFPTDGHLCSWAGLCPGDNESVKVGKPGKGTSCYAPRSLPVPIPQQTISVLTSMNSLNESVSTGVANAHMLQWPIPY